MKHTENSTGGGFTTAPVTAGHTAHIPEFLRLPKPGSRCPITGLTRSGINELVLPCESNDFRPPVKSISLRKRGAAKGVRLVVYESLISYLRAHLDGGSAK